MVKIFTVHLILNRMMRAYSQIAIYHHNKQINAKNKAEKVRYLF